MSIRTISDKNTMEQMRKLLADNYLAIDAGTDIIYVFGELRYVDISERPHSTKYCVYAVKLRQKPLLWQLSYCNKFNEMD
jgi:hypothetical protein